ncbi:MAG TPA: hypothetical protein VGN32_07970 [Ktedonobacterales bacterium]|jgi:hypothetical protein|nr:hypothetical protein [Ktedonobacterales bacterium]
METDALFAPARQIKAEADALLAASGLLDTLGTFGRVVFAGSYSLNLMVNRDIDVYVINPAHTRHSVIGALNVLIGQAFFGGYMFYEWDAVGMAGLPTGYYVGLKTLPPEPRWKFDCWFVHADLSTRTELIGRVAAATNDQRALILGIKRAAHERDLVVLGFTIYEAVLRGGVTSVAAFFRAARFVTGV